MTTRIELEELGQGLENAVSYTYGHEAANLATSLNIIIQRDFNRPFTEFDEGDILNVRILGRNEFFRVTDTEINNRQQTISLLSEDIETAYKSASKELRFMSMTPLEEKEFLSYLQQPGSNINNLPYTTFIKKFNYMYRTALPVEIEGGWWAFGGTGGKGVLEILAELIGLKVKCTLPPYRLRQFAVPTGTSIYQALLELVSPFQPNIFVKNGTLYILEPSKGYSWAGRITLKSAVDVSEKKLYKENVNPEDVVLTCGSGPFNPDRHEGPIFPEALVGTLDIKAGINSLGSIPLLSYGEFPLPETTEQFLYTPGFGATRGSTTSSSSVWDILHSRKLRYFSVVDDYAYNNFKKEIVKTSSKEEYFRYRYLESTYESPRLDSGLEINLYPMMGVGLEQLAELRTHQNWCRLVHTSNMQWKFNPLLYTGDEEIPTGDYEQVLSPLGDFEFEWRFYDKYGRLSMRSVRRYADVHTSHNVPLDWAAYQLINSATVPWREYSELSYAQGAQLSGTVVRVIPSTESGAPPFDDRTVVMDEVETFTPMGKGRAKISKKRVFLDPATSRRRTDVSSEEVSSSAVETIPIAPKEQSIVLKSNYRRAVEMLEKPLVTVSAPLIWVEEEAEEAFEFIKHHVTAPEIERNYVLPYSLYVPKGSTFNFAEVLDYRGEVLLPNRGMIGNITSFSCSKSGDSVTTNINLKGTKLT